MGIKVVKEIERIKGDFNSWWDEINRERKIFKIEKGMIDGERK